MRPINNHDGEVPTVAARTVADAFVDVLLQDDDLVRAEFDALIAASWHTGPPPPPAVPGPADRPPGWPPAPLPEPPALTGRTLTGTRLRHQRAPPLSAGTEAR